MTTTVRRRHLLRIVHGLSLGLISLLLAGCGSISKIQPSTEGHATDLTKYTRVVVASFEDKVSEKAKDPEVQARRRTGVGRFRELLALELRSSGAFTQVSTDASNEPNTLLIGGAVTRYVEGSGFARLAIGLGAGNAYFDATVEIRDAATKQLLGTVVVDRNSWGGGGVFSMSQTLDTFMNEAAKSVSAQVVAAKTVGRFVTPKNTRPR
jgi:hypothetical protein